MPISTRSQINQGQNEPNPLESSKPRSDQEQNHANLLLRNPHHGLKEKIKALTQLYEKQRQASAALRNQSSKTDQKLHLTTHPSVELDQERKPLDTWNYDRNTTDLLVPEDLVLLEFLVGTRTWISYGALENQKIRLVVKKLGKVRSFKNPYKKLVHVDSDSKTYEEHEHGAVHQTLCTFLRGDEERVVLGSFGVSLLSSFARTDAGICV
ncbi:unnamed protein product [Prunus armeniaca]|uniref:Uncharacterized protein n=1 Tax=Prunus armeniaca TaxID=36596 RepID=A0A6J5U074_PRUAR|nr:unnamed protein product [Prunus armeniaca]